MIWGKVGIVAGVYLGTRLTHGQPKSKARTLRLADKRPDPNAPVSSLSLEASGETRAPSKHPFLGASVLGLVSTSAAFFVSPALLGPITLALLTYSTTPMLLRAERRLRRAPAAAPIRIDKDSYSALISCACLASGHWSATAVYNTLYHFSEKAAGKKSNAVAVLSARLYASRAQTDATWVSRDGIELPISARQIQPGEILVINAGEMIPVEGRVIQGHGTIDAIDDTGKVNISKIDTDTTVPMASLLLEGRLEIEALRSGAECIARRAEAIRERVTRHGSKLQEYAANQADRAVLPFLAVSALTWPLFGAAPAIGLLFSPPNAANRSILSLHTASHLDWAAREGILFRDPRGLTQLMRMSAVVFDGAELLSANQKESSLTIEELRDRGITRITLIADAAETSRGPIQRLAKAVGIRDIHWQADARGKAAIITRLQEQGERVGYVGNSLNGLLALKTADLSICLGSAADYITESSDIVLLGDSLGGLVRALDSARSLPIQQTAEIGAWGAFALINTLFVILPRFSPLQSSLLCAAAFAVEYRHTTRLPKGLRAAAERQAQARRDAQANTIDGSAEVIR